GGEPGRRRSGREPLDPAALPAGLLEKLAARCVLERLAVAPLLVSDEPRRQLDDGAADGLAMLLDEEQLTGRRHRDQDDYVVHPRPLHHLPAAPPDEPQEAAGAEDLGRVASRRHPPPPGSSTGSGNSTVRGNSSHSRPSCRMRPA